MVNERGGEERMGRKKKWDGPRRGIMEEGGGSKSKGEGEGVGRRKEEGRVHKGAVEIIYQYSNTRML